VVEVGAAVSEVHVADRVITMMQGLGGVRAQRPGGYAAYVVVKAGAVAIVAKDIDPLDMAALGLASVTAFEGLRRIGDLKNRRIAVTGAAGGVGSVATAVLSKLGYHVIASTGRMAEADYLKSLGAAEVIDRAELSGPAKPLAKERWAGGIDSVGSTTLANILSMTKYGGAIAACGLAAGMDLPSSVAPFILRGVCLLGIDSVMCPIEPRKAAWSRLARDLDPGKLAEITHEIGLEGVIAAGAQILAGQVRGRIVVKIL